MPPVINPRNDASGTMEEERKPAPWSGLGSTYARALRPEHDDESDRVSDDRKSRHHNPETGVGGRRRDQSAELAPEVADDLLADENGEERDGRRNAGQPTH